jgi:hypothetical protein
MGNEAGQPEAGPQPGEVIEVTWGASKFSPRPYMTFDVGPFSMYVTVKEGETGEQAFRRGFDFLERCAREAFTRQHNHFLLDLGELPPSQQRR